jgi:type IV secretory pathway VirB10-like protein
MSGRQLFVWCVFGGLGLALGSCKKEAPEDPKKEVRLELKRAPVEPPEEKRPAANADEKKPDAKAEPKGEKVEEVREEREAANDNKVGVKECDEYIDKFRACMEQQPEADRETMNTGFESTRQAWRAAAVTDETRKELASACRAALAGARRSPAMKKCKW